MLYKKYTGMQTKFLDGIRMKNWIFENYYEGTMYPSCP